MSATSKQYYLRSMMGGIGGRKLCYLSGVSDDGLLASFTADTKLAWSFSPEQRRDFIEKHGHVGGRWVLIHNEQKRLRALNKTEG